MTSHNETSYGRPGCKDAVWQKAAPIRGRDPQKWRRDIYGNVIHYGAHGQSTRFGWDIDHYIPKAKGGSDDIANLHPVQSSKNRSMGMKMGDKDKRAWFRALEVLARARSRAASGGDKDQPKITLYDRPAKFAYQIGEQVLARQTPVAKTQLAVIESVDRIQKKVQVYWVCGGYREKIELYDKLFEKISARPRRQICI
jgi:hypothetical protein